MALSAICKTAMLDGQPPILDRQKGDQWPYRIQQLLEAYRREDPTPKHAVAIPITVLEHLRATTQEPTLAQAQADLCIIAFFYLLRVGEYTYHNPTQRRRTVQFRLQDVKLWEGTTLLDNSLPLDQLQARCTAATLTIDNQKNGKRGTTIHHHINNTPICPVQALIRRVTNITHSPFHQPDTIIGTYFDTHYPKGFTINARQITTTLKRAVRELNLQRHGIHPDQISSHSLRAGGATALHLNGYDAKTIQLLGRWSSDTFLTYIHHQIAAFSRNLSTHMATHIPFHNTQQIHIRPSIGVHDPS
jgi:hypothetical protein